jgi:DNA polymerase III epsilon subunit-like protein
LISKYVFLDLETTGFDPIRNDVTSMGAIITDSSRIVLDELYTTARPDINKFTSDEALNISGFSKAQLLLHKPQREACIDLMKFLKPHLEEFPLMMVSHTSNNFDWRFLDWMFRKQDLNFKIYKALRHDYQQSTIKMGRSAGYDGNKLNQWAERLSLTFNHHNALDDARMCLEVHKFLSKN